MKAVDLPEFTWAEIEQVKREKGTLLTFGIELSAVCNFSCIYCYAGSKEVRGHELDLADLLDVSEQAIRLGARKAGIIGAGEPTLDVRLLPMLEFLRNRISHVSLFTNGSGLTRHLSRELYELGVRIVIKINSLIPEIHDYLVGTKGGYQMMMGGLENLRDAGYPSPQHCLTVESVICAQNLGELPRLWVWARENGFQPFFERLTPLGRAISNSEDISVSPSQLLALFEKLKSIDETDYGYTWVPHPPWPGRTCYRSYYTCLINNVGNIQPCSGLNISAGNIRTSSLYSILSSSQMFDDLRHIDMRIKGTCSICELRGRCHGCRGAAYQLTGDYLASDPFCWKAETT